MARIDWTRILRRRAGIASHRFRSLHADETHAEGRAERRQTDVQVSADFCQQGIATFPSLSGSAAAIEHGQAAEIDFSVMRRLGRLFLMLAHQHREHRRQQHEDQRLDEAHQQFHEVKRNRQQPAEARNQVDIVSNMFSPAKILP